MKIDGETAGIMVAAGGLFTVLWKSIRWLIVRHDRITRSEADAINSKIAALEEAVREAQRVAHNLELKLVNALAAYRLVVSELQKHDQHSEILIHAQALLAAAYPVPSGTPENMADVIERMDAGAL